MEPEHFVLCYFWDTQLGGIEDNQEVSASVHKLKVIVTAHALIVLLKPLFSCSLLFH